MLKKCAILGVAVLLVGGLALGWLVRQTRSEEAQTRQLRTKYAINSQEYLNKYGRWHLLSPEEQNRLVLEMDRDRQGKTSQEFSEEQQARRRVDIEKLAAGQVSSGEIADFLYGSGWEEEVRKYKQLQEQKEIAHTTSIVCISVGGTVLGGCCMIWLFYGVAALVRAIRAWRLRAREQAQPAQNVLELAQIAAKETPDDPSGEAPEEPDSDKTECPAPEAPAAAVAPEPEPQKLHDDGFLPRTLGTYATSRRATLMAKKAPEDNTAAILMSDEPSSQEWSPEMQWAVTSIREDSGDDILQAPQFGREPAVSTLDRQHHAPEASNTLKEQAEGLQKQLAEFKEVAQSVQQAKMDQAAPLNNTLKELAQQVSAIRDYAASQQNRVEKLQDGYDWGIIRTFCLRVIRCLDNVEKRIEDLGPDDEATGLLEEIRDELVFALESSGVERFEPEIDGDYRGLEKLAEAVKDKQACTKPDHAGRIAKVLRAGYRYIIDDENFKIVRTAQVKLFG